MAQPSPDQQIVALVSAQAAIQARNTDQAVAMATAAAAGFAGWYDSAQIAVWAAALAARIETLQRATAQTTDAYLARVLSLMTGSRFRPIGRVDVSNLRTGVTHAGSYARAADMYRWQQHQFDAYTLDLTGAVSPQPYNLVNPVDAAVQRVISVAQMDTQLAAAAQSQQVMTDAADKGTVTGWRRVIHPELSKGGTCGLCIAASDRIYGVHEPKAVHDRCECTTLPVLEGADPGSTLNQSDLRQLYKDAGGTAAENLKRTRYQIDEHGELGQVLAPEGAKVRTPRQAASDTNPARTAKTAEQKLAQITKIRDQLAAALPKAQQLAQQDSKTWGDYLSTLEARIDSLDHDLTAA